MRGTAAALVLGLVLATVLAGCTDPPKPFQLDSVIEYLDRDKPLRWPDPVVTDSRGQAIDSPLAKDPSFGTFIQRMVAREGANPDIDFTRGAMFVTGFDRVHRSSDRGLNWTEVQTFETETFPDRQDRAETLSTVFTADEETGRSFVYRWTYGIWEPSPNLVVCRSVLQPLGLPCNYSWCPQLFYSDDDGTTWTPANEDAPHFGHNPESCVSPHSGYQMTGMPRIVVAPMAEGASLPPATPARWTKAVYVCHAFFHPQVPYFNEPKQFPSCSVSFDSGRTFERTAFVTEIPVEDALQPCEPVNVGRGATNSKGFVAFPVARFSPRGPCEPAIISSKDNGLTWQYVVAPSGVNRTNMDTEPQLVFGKDDVAYLAYRAGSNFAPYVYRIRDLFVETPVGETLGAPQPRFEGPLRISPLKHEVNSHLSIIAGDAGRIAVAYYGTVDGQDRSLYRNLAPWSVDANTVWNLYVTQTMNSLDADPTFVTVQVNSNQDPIQIGCIGLQQGVAMARAADGGCAVTMANYISLGHDAEGRIFVAFTDACDPRNDCINDFSSGFQARDRNLAVAAQQGGLSLFNTQLEAWLWKAPAIPPRHSMADST